MGHVVVVGAGHAGVQCAASLREGGFSGTVTLVSEEGHLPYQRPPLSKDHLHETAEPLPLRGPSGGFLGLELAAGARAQGVPVTVLEAAPRLLERAVSPEVSAHLRAAHGASGVRVVLGEGLGGLRLGARTAEAVVGASGELHPADLVVVSVGATPRDELARQAGLAVDDGVVVDEHLRTSDPAVLAVGDCARLSRPADGQPGRLESVQNATDQARHAAQVLLGAEEPYAAVPWFWSNQGAVRLQIAGVRSPGDATVTVGDAVAGRFSVLSFRDERLSAVESLGRPADHLAARRLLAGARLPSPQDAAAPDFQLKRFAAEPTPATT